MDEARSAGEAHGHGKAWSMVAGLYFFMCGIAVVYVLSDILSLFADVVGLPAAYAVFIIPSPALAIGAGLWWWLIERRNTYSYVLGPIVGILTAIGTGVLWTGRFIGIWGFDMISLPVIAVLTGTVLGITVLFGGLVGLPVLYARRRLVGLFQGLVRPRH